MIAYLFFYQLKQQRTLNTDKLMMKPKALSRYAQLTTPELLHRDSQWHLIRIRNLAHSLKQVQYYSYHLDKCYYLGYYYNQTMQTYDLNFDSLSNQYYETKQHQQNRMIFTLSRQNLLELYQQLKVGVNHS